MRTTAAALALATATTLNACSGGGDDTATFCDDMADTQEQLVAIGQTDAAQMDATIDALDDVNPPGEIEDAYNNIVDVYHTIADENTSITDPDMATKFADISNDIATVEAFLTAECEDR